MLLSPDQMSQLLLADDLSLAGVQLDQHGESLGAQTNDFPVTQQFTARNIKFDFLHWDADSDVPVRHEDRAPMKNYTD
jgi:hypothetical protein